MLRTRPKNEIDRLLELERASEMINWKLSNDSLGDLHAHFGLPKRLIGGGYVFSHPRAARSQVLCNWSRFGRMTLMTRLEKCAHG